MTKTKITTAEYLKLLNEWQGLDLYKGRDGVFMVSNADPLDILKLIKSFGKN